METLLKLAKDALAEGKCVVIGLQSTDEAALNEELKSRQEEKGGVKFDSLMSSLKSTLLRNISIISFKKDPKKKGAVAEYEADGEADSKAYDSDAEREDEKGLVSSSVKPTRRLPQGQLIGGS